MGETIHVGLYAPRGSDPQKPHVQDKVYFVMRGQGQIFCGDVSKACGSGDMLFVPAVLEYRFVNFTVWVFLWPRRQ